jgi:hypothetical protein
MHVYDCGCKNVLHIYFTKYFTYIFTYMWVLHIYSHMYIYTHNRTHAYMCVGIYTYMWISRNTCSAVLALPDTSHEGHFQLVSLIMCGTAREKQAVCLFLHHNHHCQSICQSCPCNFEQNLHQNRQCPQTVPADSAKNFQHYDFVQSTTHQASKSQISCSQDRNGQH